MSFNPSLYPENWPEIRCHIFTRDGYRCTECGSDQGIAVHHKDGDPQNSADENLTTLCKPHHLRADRYLHSLRQRATWERKRIAHHAPEILD